MDAGYQASFVDGAGSGRVLDSMWPQVSQLVDEALAIPLEEVAAALRLLAERVRVIAEGAGALSVAAAMSGRAGPATKDVRMDAQPQHAGRDPAEPP